MPTYKFELYISGESDISRKAVESLQEIFEQHLANQYELEIIDTDLFPERARQADIITVPTLIKNSPEPVTRLIGGLSIKSRVMAGLDISYQDVANS